MASGLLCGNRATDIWGSLLEKAYVQLNAEPGFLQHPAGNVYNLINGGFADPITQITGRSVVTYSSANYSTTAWADLKASFVTAIQGGEEVDFASYGATSINGTTAFVSGHMFSGIGYDSTTGDFIIRNPWGTQAGQSWLTSFEASIADLYSVHGVIFTATGVAADTPQIAAVTPCFVSGTLIATGSGSTVVEALRVGDVVQTVFGVTAAVTWIGHRRVHCRRHPRPWDVWPVRVRAGAFGTQMPARDLLLSPDHAVFTGGVLIPVRYLLNGATIVQEPAGSVTYWHVELERHGVLLAEGLPCESYLDTGNRGAFANGGGATAMHPDFARGMWQTQGCAPLVLDGPHLAAAQCRVLAQAAVLGHAMTDDPAIRLLADGVELATAVSGRRWRARLPDGTRQVQITSRVWRPAYMRPGETDARALGVAIGQMWLDRRAVSLQSPSLNVGWHAPEPDWRWTDGAASLAVCGVRELIFEVAMTGAYWAGSDWCDLNPGGRIVHHITSA